ncbi:copper resistance CopC family protein [Sulfitobacter sp. JB4-11]|uniref:copper resistance CopC family protein n=1 Tax=Sulfitobacter rhodophyticola TaxID=3238304 RepID=UPI00351192B9
MKQIIFAGIVWALAAVGAAAHSKTEQTTPASGATVEAVEVIELRFDDPMRVTAISLSGPEGEVAIERETDLDPVTQFRALPSVDLPTGAYTVDWRGLSSDGHPMRGTFGFVVAH